MEHGKQSREERWLQWLLPAYAFAVPISISLAEPLGFLAIAIWLYSAIRSRDRSFLKNPFFLPILVFSLIAVLSITFSVRPLASIRKCHRLLLAVVVFAIGTEMSDREYAVRRMVYLFMLACSFLAVYHAGYVLVSVRRGMDWFDTGNMRDPQMFLVALCFFLAFVLGRKRGTQMPLVLTGLILTASGLVLHFKRGAWAAFVVSVAAITLATRRWRAVAVVVGLVATLALLPQTRERIRMLEDEFSLKMGGRYALWTQVAPPLLKAHPHGMGYAATRNEDFLQYARRIQPGLHHLHNNVLQVRLELGWAGLGVWTWWMTTSLVVSWMAFRRRQRMGDGNTAWIAVGAFGAMVGLLANGMVEYNFGDSEILMLMYLVMGLMVVLFKCGVQPEGGRL